MTDETNGTNQDASQSGDPSGNAGGGTSQQPKTYTVEEFNAKVQKEVSDALAKAGRLDKALKAREDAVKAAEAAQAKIRQAEDEKAEQEAKGDPTRLSQLQRDKELRDRARLLDEREKALQAQEAENAEKIQNAAKFERENMIFKIAGEHKLDAEKLATKVNAIGLTEETQIRGFAAELVQAAAGQGIALKLDNGATGGEKSGAITVKEAEELSMEDYAERRRKQDPRIR